jgi:tetratricopeptide (TPR) repeat protein
LYTPQRLFGEVQSSSDILTHEPFLERARLQREQAEDGSARLALGAYVVARLVDKLLSLTDSSADVEAFRWQLEAVRRHICDLPDDAPETAHLTGVVTAIPSNGPHSASLWKSLNAYAYFLEQENRLEESLEMLTLAARAQGSRTSLPDFAGYALFAGRLNRQLARWDSATECYRAAEEVGIKTGDAVAKLRGRLGQGAVDRGRGNLPLARATAEDVVREATQSGLADVLAIAYADLGAVCGLLAQPLEALEAQYQAFRFSHDPQLRMRALGDVAFGLRGIGAQQAAHLAFTIVAQSSASILVRVNALLELMDIEAVTGNRLGFQRCRSAVEEYQHRMAPSMLVDYYYKLASGLARFGQRPRAQEALRKALATAEQHRLNSWYFRIEQALEEQVKIPEHQPIDECNSEFSTAPSVRQIEHELREYAAASIAN